jgi:hypothetical protein
MHAPATGGAGPSDPSAAAALLGAGHLVAVAEDLSAGHRDRGARRRHLPRGGRLRPATDRRRRGRRRLRGLPARRCADWGRPVDVRSPMVLPGRHSGVLPPRWSHCPPTASPVPSAPQPPPCTARSQRTERRVDAEGAMNSSDIDDSRSLPARIRRDRMLALLREQEFVRVSELADRFDVSEVTVRADLDALEQRSELRRVRGGALPRASAPPERRFEEAEVAAAAQKRAIGRAAAALIEDGDTLILDVGTTTTAVAQALAHRADVADISGGVHELADHRARTRAGSSAGECGRHRRNVCDRDSTP